MVGVLTLHLLLPGCTSLKEKRHRLKPLLVRLQREFNLSVAEMDYQDRWQEALIACALVNNDAVHIRRSLQIVVTWVEQHWSEGLILTEQVELY
ncbi:MAG: DUF503 domain-containing protein [Anaerolineales bacterium]